MVLSYDSVNIGSSSSNVSTDDQDLDQHLSELETSSEKEVRKLRRIVEKNGTFNVINQPGWMWFNPLDSSNILEMKWFSFIFIFSIVYGATFIIFGGLFLVPDIMHARNGTLCYEGVVDIMTGFLFAFETGQTIGYGTRYPLADCPDGIILLFINIFWTTFLATVFSGIFLAKFASNKSHSQDIRFSSQALICMRNGSLFLMFRVADPMESGMDYGAEAKAICVRFQDDIRERDEEVEGPRINFLQVRHISLGFQVDGTKSDIPLLWPTTVSHRIDSTSPLYTMGPDKLASTRLELIITLSGVRTETGAAIKNVTSYTNEEIVWGARFCQSCVLTRGVEGNVASFSQEDVDKHAMDFTPRLSAEKMDRIKAEVMGL